MKKSYFYKNQVLYLQKNYHDVKKDIKKYDKMDL